MSGVGRVRPNSSPTHSAVIDPLLPFVLQRADVHGFRLAAQSGRGCSRQGVGANWLDRALPFIIRHFDVLAQRIKNDGSKQ